MSDVAYCVEDGCRNEATGSRPEGMAGDTPVVELVCDAHGLPDPTISMFDGPTWIDWTMIAVFVVGVVALLIYAAV